MMKQEVMIHFLNHCYGLVPRNCYYSLCCLMEVTYQKIPVVADIERSHVPPYLGRVGDTTYVEFTTTIPGLVDCKLLYATSTDELLAWCHLMLL